MNDLTLYNQYRAEMKTGDLLTYETGGLVSSLIHLWSKANHAGLVLAPREFEGEINRRWTIEAVGVGVRTAYLSDLLLKEHGRVYWHRLKPEFDYARNEIGCYAFSKSGVTAYDFWSLCKMPFKLVSADLSKYLCSELAFLSYRDGGHIVKGKYIPIPDQLPELGVTEPPVLILDSPQYSQDPAHPPVNP